MKTEKKMTSPPNKPIEPLKEMVAYEALWEDRAMSFKNLANLISGYPGSRFSDFVKDEKMKELYPKIKDIVLTFSKYKIQTLIYGAFDYPERLRDAQEPLDILYYAGNLDLLSTRGVAIVGSRKPSVDGLRRTMKLVRLLAKDNFTIVSGLATGVDTQAHLTAIEEKARTIAVIGTPLDQVYPKENSALQEQIAKEHLLVSQVPFCRYRQQTHYGNRLFFPERNKTMSALTDATIIVEASDTSGTLIQAKAALQQGRKLFILESCFQNKNITWPGKFLAQGAIRVRDYDDIRNNLIQSD